MSSSANIHAPLALPSFAAATGAADLEAALAASFARQIAQLARRMGASADGIRWAQRAAFAVSRATSDGHVCVRLATLAQRYDASVDEVRAALRGTAVVTDLADLTSPAPWRPLVIDAQARLYLARYYVYEQRLARALVAHLDQGEQPVPVKEMRACLSRFFGAARNDGVDWQRVAAVLALSGRLVVISGGPGTGKTTTVAMILACLIYAQEAASSSSSLRIALAAPTGKAAQRMQEALRARAAGLPPALAAQLPDTSYTLHRLLRQRPDGSFRYGRDNPLPYDLLVIDEASMIDLALATHLFDAIAPTTRLILLGDKDQLAAVEAGAVFAELSARPAFGRAMQTRLAAALDVDASLFAPDAADEADAALTDCVVWLEHNYRFGLDSPIGQLARAIQRGAAHDALHLLTRAPAEASTDNQQTAALHEDAADTLCAATLAQLEAGFAPYAQAVAQALAQPRHAEHLAPLFDALNHFRVLCATHMGARGVAWLNAQLGAPVRQLTQSAHPAPLWAKGNPWFAGRPVTITRNDYALGLFNGDTGIALPAGDGALRVWFCDSEGRARAIAPAALPPHDTAFALTVHKSQGSEFDRVALVLPAHAHALLTRELVYTAITRAKTSVDIYSSREALAHAIATPTRRDSGLASRIAEALRARADATSS